MNDTTEIIRKPIGTLEVIAHWHPRETYRVPIYWLKTVPMEGCRGRRLCFVGVEIDNSIVQIQADPRDVVLDGRA